MRRLALLVVMLVLGALPGGAGAQVVLRSCLEEASSAEVRIDICSRLVQSATNDATRAMALFGRAQARMDIVSAQPEEPPTSAYDPVLADLDLSYATFRSAQALTLRAIVRFHRGDVAPALFALFRGGEWEAAAVALGPMIAAAPDDPDLLLLRAAFHGLTGNADGARQDREQALRIAGRAP